MQRVNDVIVLDLESTVNGNHMVFRPSAIVMPDGTLTLVDTGLPGMAGVIDTQLREAGFSLDDVKQVIVTHHDLDHIGSLEAVVGQTGADVLALEAEVPYITGEKRSQKLPSEEQTQQLLADPNLDPARRAMLTRPPVRVPVTRALHDGEDLPGGLRIVATPGHTVGHASVYVSGSRTLITGDALTSQDGTLKGPNERATPDMPTALESVKKLAGLDVQTILAYHGGLVTENADAQLKELAAHP
ncbi:glyoxylase-like metal-dependent hydrolase (beta-lactamase superfamily II) [Deinococcus metalli]|uniref:Hydrolase n=1 Tax=Deinococcus metalli TaxID=1141878 RepID=A0A7W8KHF3_9DEIO|nr:MBL fold metallo-hydrolase [Deinococcus metalli]MBB5378175.1 glyoxylase-like metal-dependent hydrolase (beta-lactamase superfamily II) [Deinococcus metalli]GHF56597.1 hydrolase [Deinococcus metalli]